MARSRPLTDREIVVAIDLGTSACKVVAFDRLGNRVAYGHSPYCSLIDTTGRVEQNASIWWNAVKTAVRIAEVERHQKRIVAYSVSSLRAAVLPVDFRGRALRAAILASDLRATREAKWVATRFGESALYKKTGLRVSTYASLARILWLKKNKPKVFLRAAKLFCAQDYLIYQLTGRAVTDRSHASRTLCFNIHTKAWDWEVLRILDLSHELFPDVVDPGTVVGKLHPTASRALGIPVAPVVAAGGDQMCASVGLGGTFPGEVTVNHGTGSFVEQLVQEPTLDPSAGSLCSVHVLANCWIQEFPLLTTGRNLEALVKLFQGPTPDPATLINTALSNSMRHADTRPLLFLPYQAGSTAPHWNSSLPGAIWGLQSNDGGPEIVRAFLESVAFDLRRCVQKLPTAPGEISVGGRLAKLQKYNQLQADVLGIPIVRTAEYEATALGSAMLGFVALGIHSSSQHAAQAMVRRIASSRCQPRTKQAKMYHQLFEAQEKLLELTAKLKG
jgi:sugar (pentulose or hexulose) kinase